MKLKFVLDTVFRENVYTVDQVVEFSDADGRFLVALGKAQETVELAEEKKIVKKAKADA